VETVPIPDDDRDRVTSLRRLGLLDTDPEERFDRITRIAHRLFGVDSVTFALVDVDRSWCKSTQGVAHGEEPRADALCARPILDPDKSVMVVADALRDPRFAGLPSVLGDPPIRFYAGAPIAAPDGAIVGTLSLTDEHPRSFDDGDVRSLRDLADMVEREIAVAYLAVDDELTGLANRRGFMMMASQALAFCERQQIEALVVLAGVEGLGSVNRHFGQDAGDALLRHAASAVADAFRASDVVGRLGGDQFAAVLTSFHGEEEWATKRLATGVQACNDQMTGDAAPLSMAVGCTTFDPDRPELLEVLLGRAGAAMGADKEYRSQWAAHRDPI
jgi:diguanylate cyclase (GGDEF)-like protein